MCTFFVDSVGGVRVPFRFLGSDGGSIPILRALGTRSVVDRFRYWLVEGGVVSRTAAVCASGIGVAAHLREGGGEVSACWESTPPRGAYSHVRNLAFQLHDNEILEPQLVVCGPADHCDGCSCNRLINL